MKSKLILAAFALALTSTFGIAADGDAVSPHNHVAEKGGPSHAKKIASASAKAKSGKAGTSQKQVDKHNHGAEKGDPAHAAGAASDKRSSVGVLYS
ncbi:MAG: hypothetical protein C4516_09170 [Oxalobacter sp.]|nr:MAG: hypothetical protein C4516_09170 [Oxalobacter sp.]